PEEKPRPDQVAQNFGVDTSRCQGEAHYLRGEKVTRREVYEAVGSQLPDDRDKLRIHLIGPKAETRPFVEAIPGDILQWALCQATDPADPKEAWRLKGPAGEDLYDVQPGGVNLILCEPDGGVRHHQVGELEPRERVFTALR